ncbi:MAG: SPOR domain-containing protein [Casimicrobiaceae bacterium]
MATQSKAPARASRRPAPRRRAAGGTLLGIFIGLVMGLALAAGVAFYLMGGRSVYQSQVTAAQKELRDPAHDAAKTPDANKAADKPRFDFYKILPGGEEPKIGTDKAPVLPDRALVAKAAEKSAETRVAKPGDVRAGVPKSPDKAVEKVASVEPLKDMRAGDRFWLQAGSFTDQADAENLKAQLALGGWQAAVQQGILADKSVRYRVRLGPYDNSEELARVKNQLKLRGYESAAIRY